MHVKNVLIHLPIVGLSLGILIYYVNYLKIINYNIFFNYLVFYTMYFTNNLLDVISFIRDLKCQRSYLKST